MADDREKLRETLSRLQTQLDQLRDRHPELAGELESSIADVESALVGNSPESGPSLVQRLKETVLQLEAEHPTVAGTLNRVIDALAQAGI